MKVLILSPHFPPTNAADMQRIRLILPYLAENGISAEVLAVHPDCVNGSQDSWLLGGLPKDVPIHRVRGMAVQWGRVPGLGTLANRAFNQLSKAGDRLLKAAESANSPFDMVYVSTTQFGLNRLGALWKQQFGVPFVLDYQDPWVSDYYKLNSRVRPPGGRLKYFVVQQIASRTEPLVLRQCAGVTSVSATYLEQLRLRYAFLRDQNLPMKVAPFPGDSLDIDRVRNASEVRQTVFRRNDGHAHWVYIGRGGEDMHVALKGFFSATRRYIDENVSFPLRIHFVGTSYASSGKGVKTVQPIADEFGVGHLVEESTDRIPYSEALQCLLEADALVVPGSDDPGYTASKIYPYLLCRKPLLTIFHSQSSVNDLTQKVGGAIAVSFSTGTNIAKLSSDIYERWFQQKSYEEPATLDLAEFEPFTARWQAARFSEFFREVV